MRLVNKTVLITGGTSGIGEATVRLFVEEGATVAFTGRREDRGRALEAETHAVYIAADHRIANDCIRSVDQAAKKLSRIDVLFNNAGVVHGGTAESTPDTVWHETIALNVTAVWKMSQAVLPIMRQHGGGVIINNASDWGLVGAPNALAYCTSKGAVIQLTRCMALDHAEENIRVNAICPGDTFVQRWLEEGYFRKGGKVTEAQARLSESIPMRRVGDVKEIARAVLFLASEDSSYLTGVALPVDGGNTAQ